MCDRRQDIQDLLAMNVTEKEIQIAEIQVKKMDANPDWPEWVEHCISEIVEQRREHE